MNEAQLEAINRIGLPEDAILEVGKVADCANQFIGKKAPRLCGPIGYTTVNS